METPAGFILENVDTRFSKRYNLSTDVYNLMFDITGSDILEMHGGLL